MANATTGSSSREAKCVDLLRDRLGDSAAVALAAVSPGTGAFSWSAGASPDGRPVRQAPRCTGPRSPSSARHHLVLRACPSGEAHELPGVFASATSASPTPRGSWPGWAAKTTATPLPAPPSRFSPGTATRSSSAMSPWRCTSFCSSADRRDNATTRPSRLRRDLTCDGYAPKTTKGSKGCREKAPGHIQPIVRVQLLYLARSLPGMFASGGSSSRRWRLPGTV